MATYTGVLTGGRIEWTGGAKPPDGPVTVEVVGLPPLMSDAERRDRLGQLLDELAARGNIDAAEWGRVRLASRTRKDPRDE